MHNYITEKSFLINNLSPEFEPYEALRYNLLGKKINTADI